MNAPAEEPLEVHTIELADTRPTMLWVPYLGEVPIQLGAIIFGIAGVCFVALGWKYSLWGPVAWFGTARLVALDYHAITRVERWLNTSAWTLDANNQGGASTTPFPLKSTRPRGMAGQ